MLICRTPYRLSFYGGGLDYPEWYNNNDTSVLTAALGYYCYQTVRELPPFFSHKYRAAYSAIELTNSVDEIKHPSVRECIRTYAGDLNIEITHIGDLPARSGIGSSSAFTVGLIKSLLALQGRYISGAALATAAINLEQSVMKEVVGFQDQCASALGGVVLVKAGKEGVNPRRFIARKEYLDYICENLLLGFNGSPRFSGTFASKTVQSLSNGQKLPLLLDLSAYTKAGIKLFVDEADVSMHAEITRKCRDIKLRLNGDIKNNNLMDLLTTTEKAGSLCTRVLGAGGGGFILCWAPKHRHIEIKKSVCIKTWVDVCLSSTGSEMVFSE